MSRLAALALSIALSASQQQPPATGTGVIAGQVIDATTKKPVAGVVVALTQAAPAAATSGPLPAPGTPPSPSAAPPRRGAAVTNTEGRFVFRDVPAGTYSLTATRSGYSPGATGRRRPGGPSRTFSLADGARVTDAAVPLWPLSTISGTVRDDRGEPVIGAYATAMRRTIVGSRLEVTFAGGGGEATDDRGHYRIANLEPGSYVVAIRTTPQTAAVSTVDTYRSAAASGTALTMARELREGGAIQMSMDGIVIGSWQLTGSNEPLMMPGPNGTLLLPPTTYSGNARTPAEATTITLGSGDHRQGIDLTLPLVAGVRVSGTLTGPNGPAANHGIQLVPAGGEVPVSPFPVAYSITDASGRFALLGVTPGAYLVRARRMPIVGPIFVPPSPTAGAGAGREAVVMNTAAPIVAMFAEAPVTVGSSHVDNVGLTLQTGARVSGRIVFEGATVPPAAAQLQRIQVAVRALFGGDSPGFGAQTNVDASGNFQTIGVAPSRYLLTATPPGPEWSVGSIRVNSVDASDQAVEVGTEDVTGVVVTFTDKTMTVSGTVQPAAGSKDPEATVIAFPADIRAWVSSGMSLRRYAAAVSTPSGSYQLRLAAPGEYLIAAIPPEIAPVADPEFLTKLAASATRITIAAGETKTQPLTVSRVR